MRPSKRPLKSSSRKRRRRRGLSVALLRKVHHAHLVEAILIILDERGVPPSPAERSALWGWTEFMSLRQVRSLVRKALTTGGPAEFLPKEDVAREEQLLQESLTRAATEKRRKDGWMVRGPGTECRVLSVRSATDGRSRSGPCTDNAGTQHLRCVPSPVPLSARGRGQIAGSEASGSGGVSLRRGALPGGRQRHGGSDHCRTQDAADSSVGGPASLPTAFLEH